MIKNKSKMVTSKLGEICSIKTGKKDVNQGAENGRFPFYTCAKEIHRSDESSFEGAAVLVAGNGFFNVKYHREGRFEAYQRTYVLQDFEIDPKYLFCYIDYALDDITKNNRGSTIRYIRLGDLRDYEVTFPEDLSEQRRIVARIEELFSRLDAGVAALRHAKAQLQRYRQSVLAAAVTGQLTQAWREQHPDTEPAEELLERALSDARASWGGKRNFVEPAILDPKGLPELPSSWTWTGVEQTGEVKLGRQRSPKQMTGDHIRPYLRVANVYEARIDTSDVNEMNFTPDEFKVFELKYGDILLNEGQSLEWVGRPAMYRDEIPGCCFQNTLVRYRAHESVLPLYALTVFRSYLHRGRFQKIAKWTNNIAHLGAGRFKEIEFPLPPLAEQHQIVAEVEARTTAIDRLEAELTRQITRSKRLRQSTLASAFSGQI